MFIDSKISQSELLLSRLKTRARNSENVEEIINTLSILKDLYTQKYYSLKEQQKPHYMPNVVLKK